jgi:hypothetical protein
MGPTRSDTQRAPNSPGAAAPVCCPPVLVRAGAAGASTLCFLKGWRGMSTTLLDGGAVRLRGRGRSAHDSTEPDVSMQMRRMHWWLSMSHCRGAGKRPGQ